jgi:TRAP-type C4-dicarboxylate transport system substrate-binding protein
MTRIAPLIAVLAMLAIVPSNAQAPAPPIRMATLVPSGSLWDRHLKAMGDEWRRTTAGRVSLTIYPGGAMGDEATIVRKLRFNNPQAAALSAIGLSRIDDAFAVFGMPFFFGSYDELSHVLGELTPVLAQRLADRDLVLLAWGHVGWAYMFTTTPVTALDELKRVSIFTSAGDPRMLEWYRNNGFQPRALATTDILTGLSGGLIQGLPAPPSAMLAFQWFRQARFMVDRGIAPVIGAVVVTRKAWDAMGEPDRSEVRRAALELERRLNADVPRVEAESIAEMRKRGLTVVPVKEELWESSGRSMASTLPGIPADIHALALQSRDAYRMKRR